MRPLFLTWVIALGLLLHPSLLAAQIDSAWKVYAFADVLIGLGVDFIHESQDGTMWLASNSDDVFPTGVSRLDRYTGTWSKRLFGSSNINDLAEGPMGTMWFGTGDGLFRCDAEACQHFIPESLVQAVAVRSDGVVFFATSDAVFRLRGQQAEILWSGAADQMIANEDGTLWFATEDGVYRYHPDGSVESFLLGHSVRSMIPMIDGTLYFATDLGAHQYHEGILNTVLPGLDIISIRSASDGILWFALNNGDVYKSSPTDTAPQSVPVLDDAYVTSIIEAPDGTMWFRGREAVHFLPTYSTIPLLFDDWGEGIADYSAATMAISSDGMVWFSDFFDLRRYDPTWQSFLSDIAVAEVITTADGTIWLRSQSGGIWRFDKGAFIQVFPDIEANLLFAAQDGSLWIGLSAGGLVRWREGESLFFPGEAIVQSIVEGIDGTLFFVDNLSARLYADETFTTFLDDLSLDFILPSTQGDLFIVDFETGVLWVHDDTVEVLLPDKAVIKAVEAADGAVWFIALTDDDHGSTYRVESGHIEPIVEDDQVFDLFAASDGSVWFGSQRLFRYADGQLDRFLEGREIFRIYEAPDGTIWVHTLDAVLRFKEGAWQVFDNTNTPLDISALENIGFGADGTVWFASLQGVTRMQATGRSRARSSIHQAPTALWGSDHAFFEFVAGEIDTDLPPVVSYSLVRQGQPPAWTPFAADYAFAANALSNGAWTLNMHAMDRFGQIEATAQETTFVVDTVPPTVAILSPGPSEVIVGQWTVVGLAEDRSQIPDLQHYTLAYAPGRDPTRIGETAWREDTFSELNNASVVNGPLGVWDTTELADGDYLLRLQAVDALGHVSKDVVAVTIASALGAIVVDAGNTIEDPSGRVTLYIPPRAAQGIEQLVISTAETSIIDPPPFGQLVGPVYTITPDSLVFGLETGGLFVAKPAVLRLTVPDRHPAQEQLAIAAVNDGVWTLLGGTMNPTSNSIDVPLSRTGRITLIEPSFDDAEQQSLTALACQPRAFGPGTRFGDTAFISFALGAPGHVQVKIFDTEGRLVRTLTDRPMQRGEQLVVWDGQQDDGRSTLSGLYIIAVEAYGKVETTTVGVMKK